MSMFKRFPQPDPTKEPPPPAAAKADEKKPEPTLAETIVGGVIVLLLVGSCVYITKRQEYIESLDPPESKAWQIAQSYVENSLRCPSTASFVGGNVVKFTPQGYDEETKEKITLKGYDVYGSVDSQNLFGATVRCQFYCRLYYNPRTKKWKLGDLRIHQPGLPALD